MKGPELAMDHQGGPNFSRAWSVYATAAGYTDETRRRDLVAAGDRYVQATFGAPEVWRDDYLAHAHWGAQFGLHALDLRHEAVAGR